jgi:hypothetical protein
MRSSARPLRALAPLLPCVITGTLVVYMDWGKWYSFKVAFSEVVLNIYMVFCIIYLLCYLFVCLSICLFIYW